MRILRTPKSLSKALAKIVPSKVAVAYVGQGWKTWIGGNNHRLIEIVISPTTGSNPYAIEEIIQEVGIENVHFLDKLHTKLYMGDGGFMIGSPNLSDNGFGLNGNREMAVLFEVGNGDYTINFDKLNDIFEDYKTEARAAYPTANDKMHRLGELYKNWQETNRRGLANEEGTGSDAPSIKDWKSKLDRIHVVWWINAEVEYDEQMIVDALPEASGLSQQEISDLFDAELQFHNDDDIRVGDWVLSWRCRKRDFGVATSFWGDVDWVYVDTVIPDAYADPVYKKLAGTRTPLPPSFPPPFALTNAVKKRILEVLASGEFPELLGTFGNPWLLQPADKVIRTFLASI